MKDQFQLAAGSILGRDHARVGKNNQDAFAWVSLEQATIAVVCDGCGSSASSEVGAQLGARLCVKAIAHQLTRSHPDLDSDFWGQVQQDLLVRLQSLILSLRDQSWDAIKTYLLFTIVGGLITPTSTLVFGLGDGIFAINGAIQIIGPFANNAPPYLAYALEPPGVTHLDAQSLKLQVYCQLPTPRVESLLLGSDGVEDLIKVAHQPLPGKSEWVGELSQFWQADRYFNNPDTIRRRLALINREVIQPDWQAQQLTKRVGLLPDDTTLIAIRRKATV